MNRHDLRHAAWRKSSYSSANSNCVEVAFAGSAVAVRDSKNPAAGHLDVSESNWSALRAQVVDTLTP